MAWEYNVKEIAFKHNGEFMFFAIYAGAIGYKNDPRFECIKYKGPLPRGKYFITGKPFTHPVAGAYTLRLTPSTNNNMCGRDGFLIHGDSRLYPGTASNGCIVLAREFRRKIYESDDRELIVL